jgi:Domain of unknown function (DUF4326)
MPHELVVNVRSGAECDIYVGRRQNGNHYGNPFSHLPLPHIIPVGSRDDSIAAYRAWLEGTAHQEVEPDRRAWILANLKQLSGKRLGCFCSPANCHAEVLVELSAKSNAASEAEFDRWLGV